MQRMWFTRRVERSFRWLLLLSLGTISLGMNALAQAEEPPLLEQQQLFTAGEGGYALYRIPGLIVTPRGSVLVYCEARRTGKSDWDAIDLLIRRSVDGGNSFDAPRSFAAAPADFKKHPLALRQNLANPNDVTLNNPVAFADHKTGAVHMLYCVDYARIFAMRSDDDGQTFSAPVEITRACEPLRTEYPWQVLATGPGHGIQLTNGRLLVPIWLSLGTGGHAHRPSITSTLYSDDGGRTWQAGGIAVADQPPVVNPNETVAVQRADGQVMLNVRSESQAHRRIVVTSPDGARDWSPARFDDGLVEPICMAGIVRVSLLEKQGRHRILFSHPDNLMKNGQPGTPGQSRDRRNLSLKLSYDEGQTWAVNRVLEPGPSAYSDLATLPDGRMLCFYERTLPGSMPAVRVLTLARFNLEWLTDGRDHWNPAAPGAR